MAPDAEKTRNQFHDGGSEVDVHGITIESLSGDEVAIDGIVYTLNDFNHPGGDQIKLFGGNDVTVQYKVSYAMLCYAIASCHDKRTAVVTYMVWS